MKEFFACIIWGSAVFWSCPQPCEAIIYEVKECWEVDEDGSKETIEKN